MRFFQYEQALKAKGWQMAIHPFFPPEYIEKLYGRPGRFSLKELLTCYGKRLKLLLSQRHFDLVWIENEWLPKMPFFFEGLFLGNTPWVVNYDDAVYLPYQKGAWIKRFLLGKKIDKVMAHAHALVVGNDHLRQYAQRQGASWLLTLPSVIDMNHFPPVSGSLDPSTPLKVGWVGTPATASFLEMLLKPLQRCAQAFALEFHVMGAGSRLDALLAHCPFHVNASAWVEGGEAAFFQKVDVGVMPLPDTPFTRGKCAFKLIQTMAAGRPFIASGVGMNRDLAAMGSFGFLADDEEAWVEALTVLNHMKRTHPERLKALGREARETARAHFSVEATSEPLHQFFLSVLGGR